MICFSDSKLLYGFLYELLNSNEYSYKHIIIWKDKANGIFKIVDSKALAKLWGIRKNHSNMNYDKLSRALRYYYKNNKLRKVAGERLCYQ